MKSIKNLKIIFLKSIPPEMASGAISPRPALAAIALLSIQNSKKGNE